MDVFAFANKRKIERPYILKCDENIYSKKLKKIIKKKDVRKRKEEEEKKNQTRKRSS